MTMQKPEGTLIVMDQDQAKPKYVSSHLCSRKYLSERSAKCDSDLHHGQRTSTHYSKWEVAPLVHSEKFDMRLRSVDSICRMGIRASSMIPYSMSEPITDSVQACSTCWTPCLWRLDSPVPLHVPT